MKLTDLGLHLSEAVGLLELDGRSIALAGSLVPAEFKVGHILAKPLRTA